MAPVNRRLLDEWHAYRSLRERGGDAGEAARNTFRARAAEMLSILGEAATPESVREDLRVELEEFRVAAAEALVAGWAVPAARSRQAKEELMMARGRPKRTEDNPRRCRVCRCSNEDASGCIARTGERCYWVAWDLCSACVGKVDKQQIFDLRGRR